MWIGLGSGLLIFCVATLGLDDCLHSAGHALDEHLAGLNTNFGPLLLRSIPQLVDTLCGLRMGRKGLSLR